MKKYEIGSELWTAQMAGRHARMQGQATNPHDQNSAKEQHNAWQEGWQAYDDLVSRGRE